MRPTFVMTGCLVNTRSSFHVNFLKLNQKDNMWSE